MLLIGAVVGCVPYGIWILHAVTRRNWKRIAVQLVTPCAALLCLWAVSAICGIKMFPNYYANLFDTDTTLRSPIFEYDSGRSGLGDGYSISVYKLPEEIRRRFESADARLLTSFPRRPFYCMGWDHERWRETPNDIQFQEHLEFALSRSFSLEAEGLSAQFEAVRSAMRQPGNYYSLFYYTPNGGIGNIYFYVVDLVGGRLYLMNQDT